MSTVSPPDSRSAALPAPREPYVVAHGRATRAPLPTPLFTRHMPGAIEVERQQRAIPLAPDRRRWQPTRGLGGHLHLVPGRPPRGRRGARARRLGHRHRRLIAALPLRRVAPIAADASAGSEAINVLIGTGRTVGEERRSRRRPPACLTP